jgi:hypothetical protein
MWQRIYDEKRPILANGRVVGYEVWMISEYGSMWDTEVLGRREEHIDDEWLPGDN